MYTFDSRIRYSEVDEEQRLTLVSLIDYFQDCSTFQSEDLGVGLGYMEELGAAWIINFWQIDILRLPVLGERVVTGTSPYGFKGFMGYRNFAMETAEGEPLAMAASVWSLMDLKNLRPVRPTQKMLEKYAVGEPFAMEYEDRKIRIPAAGERTGQAYPQEIVIERDHLDTNHHVNNARYAAFAVSAAGEAGAAVRSFDRFCIEYRKQAHLGDRLWPAVFTDTQGRVTVLLNDEPWPADDADYNADRHIYAAARFGYVRGKEI